MKQYISDIITEEEICKWLPGNRVLICSQTGTGKSQMIKDGLYEYAKKHNNKILLLSNRNVLKKQNEEELKDSKSDIITLKNYQTLESSIIQGNEISDLLKRYDYIIFDECHYILSDSTFNLNTDILLSQLKNPNKDNIYVFITATPEAILTYQNTFEFKYDIQKDYSYIKELYFYSREETLNNILEKIPSNEKVIYFGNALDSLELSLSYNDSSFLCSEHNKNYYKRISKFVSHDIEKDNTFKTKMLFTTKVLDNGINIIDKNIKHIVIQMFDGIDVVQCLGRKRIIDENDTVTVYIKNFHGGEIFPRIKNINDKFKMVQDLKEFGKEKFQEMYTRKILDPIIQNNFEINQAKLYYYKYFKNMASIMLRKSDENDTTGYKKYICKCLEFPYDKIKIAEEYYEKESLTDALEEYLNKKLYGGIDQEVFKEVFFNKLFKPQRKLDYRKRGYNTMNAILQEDGLPYFIASIKDKDKSSPNKGKYYWIVNKINLV
jgi:hypothetical protein